MKVQEGLKKFKNVHEVQVGSGRFKKVHEDSKIVQEVFKCFKIILSSIFRGMHSII